VPLHWLRSMPMDDLRLYQRYTARRSFPGRRIELLLAQVALVLARVNGNENTYIQDFLFDPQEPEDPAQRDLSGFFD
jgi:hypothetical protein